MTVVKISKNNSKLGNIPSFSLPSITSCPGATTECKDICYAAKVERIYKNAAKSYEVNLTAINEKDFVDSVVTEITKLTSKKKKAPTTFRWGVSGDIVDIKYLHKIKQVMLKLPNVTFYAYTRNWSMPNWIPYLEDIKTLPNFTLIASVDDEHLSKGLQPSPTWRTAYVGKKSLKEYSSLINKKTITCPNQVNGVLCDTCKYCFNPKLINTTHSVYFIKH